MRPIEPHPSTAPFVPEVGEAAHLYFARLARDFGVFACAAQLESLPLDDERIRQLNALAPTGRARQFPSADALTLLREFPDTSADVLLRTILATESGAAIEAESQELLDGE